MKSSLILLLCTILFQVLPIFNIAGQSLRPTDTLWFKGVSLLQAGRQADAIDIFKQFDAFLVSENRGTDSIRIATLHKLNKCHFELYEHDQAIKYANIALNLRPLVTTVSDHQWFLLYSSRSSSRATQKQFEESKADLDTASTFLSTENYPTEDHSELYSNYGFYYQQKGDDKKALEYFYNALDTDTLIYGVNNDYTAGTYNNIGASLGSLGMIEKAIEHYEKSLKIRIKKHGANGDKTSRTYHNLANAYSDIGRFEKALEYRLQVLRTGKRTYDSREPNATYAIYHLNVADSYFKNGDYDKAVFHLRECLSIFESIPGFNPHIFTSISYLELSKVLNEQGKIEAAYDAVEQSIHIGQSLPIKYPTRLASSFATKARYDADQLDYAQAKSGFHRAISILLESKSNKHKLLAGIYYQLGLISNNEGNFEEAQKAFLNGLSVLYSGQITTMETADIDQFSKVPELPKLLGSYGAVCRQLYISRGDTLVLKSGIRALQLGTTVIEEIIDNVNVLRDKINLNEPLRYIYEELLLSLKLLPQSNNLDKLEVVNKAKSTIQRQIEKRYLNNGNATYQQYAQLRAYNKRLLQDTTNTNIHAQLQQEVFDLSYKLDSIQGYEEVSDINHAQSINEIQSSLSDSLSILNFYFSGNELNSFLITKDSIFHFSSNAAELESKVLQMLGYLDGSLKSTVKEFSQLSSTIYDFLREPLDLSIANSNRVIIIPDGILSYLPFSVLTSQVSQNKTFGTLPYILHEIEISYAYSLFDIEVSNTPIGNEYLGISPVFEAALQLPSNQKEVLATASAFTSTNILDGIAANKDNFLKAVPNHNIYHLATHAIADDEHFEESLIYFSSDDDDAAKNTLSFSEISTLHLKESMAILSACQTGTGKLYSGQGIMSLAKAFKLAGCKNLITTLWDLNDKVSSTLLPSFAEAMSEGESSPSALASSKIKYLSSDLADGLKHPKYWANYICIGQTSVRSNTPLNQRFIIAITIFLALAGLFFFRKLS